jgi:hypothetical protein
MNLAGPVTPFLPTTNSLLALATMPVGLAAPFAPGGTLTMIGSSVPVPS